MPTEEEIKEFWEWCGIPTNIDTNGDRFYLTEGKWTGLPIDLNNLFKWAVPKVIEEGLTISHYFDNPVTWSVEIGMSETKDKDPALALFWAIYKVIDHA